MFHFKVNFIGLFSGVLVSGRSSCRSLIATLLVATAFQQAVQAQALNSVDTTAQLTYFNSRVMPKNAYRVLFIGDSLTYHAQTPGVWDYTSGMAASSPVQDFVHLAMQHMQERMGTRPVEMLIDNGGDGRIGTMLTYLKKHPELKPSLVVLQGGENDKFDETFQATYRALLDFYADAHVPYIVLGDWWSGEKSQFDHAEMTKRGYAWVDLARFYNDPSLSGNGGPYKLPAVAKHPNDKGMQAIANGIDERFDTVIFPAKGSR